MDSKRTWTGIAALALSLLFAVGGMAQPFIQGGNPMIAPADLGNIRITIVYDNFGGNGGLRSDWGFSCLIEGLEQTILFDTGLDPSIFASNMEILKIAPERVDLLVLSHEHGDHIGGLPALLERRSNLAVWVPVSFSDPVKTYIRKAGARLEAVDAPRRICREAATLGTMSSGMFQPDEQALYIATDHGGIVITGCAHPGIVQIVERARKTFREPILLVMGGFHLAGHSEAQIHGIIEAFKAMEVKYAAPCHCSGLPARRLFHQAFGRRYIEVGVGRIVTAADFADPPAAADQ